MTSNLFVELQEKLEGKKVRIVFPENLVLLATCNQYLSEKKKKLKK